MKKLTITLAVMFCLTISMISLANAEINNFAPVKQGESITIKQVCASCSYVNLSVSFPNSTLAITNEGMSNQGGGTWTYEFSNTSEIGRYDVQGSGDLSGTDTGFDVLYFEVTKTGKILETGETLIYFILAFGVFLLFGLSFYFMLAVPYGNEINEKGAVIQITKLKYVKLALILLTWVLFTWFLNILIGLSDNFVSLTMYYGFFGFIFTIMNSLALWVGLVVLVIAFFEIIRDANIQKNLALLGGALR